MLCSRISSSVALRRLVNPSILSKPTSVSHVRRSGLTPSRQWNFVNLSTRYFTSSSSLPSASTPLPPKSTDHGTSTLQHEAGLDQNQPPVRYEPPKSGFLSYLPASFVPYAELIRIDKPVGTYYLLFPCIFSTLLAAPLASPITAPSTVLATSALFATGALVMRGAGCTINDLWDRNLDPKVARTRLRPIARGAVSPEAAIIYTGCQLLTGLAVLLQFPFECFFYATPSLLLVSTYPLAKRVTNYPQAVLGLTFSWGAIMGFPALGVDLLSNPEALTAAACLYASNIAWTILYDMIYAHQDIKDDAKAGIKSIALRHEKNTKAVLSGLAIVHTTLLAAAGAAIGAGPIFYIGTCGGALLTTANMIWRVRLSSVKNCWWWFRSGCWMTGGAITLGLTGEYLAHYLGWYEDEP
ncbi:para-hydroxybenzoate-polyprenyltransferase Coq2 [Aureobasidium pullulans]|uniref:4-hydroxybenzoate polyprenyltransferase, mitochondrial n=1 Tax=Aureobasidium pullulans TaxID=5580 RepID=A0A4S9LQQ7_AURPU|nr:para-hydroxybenzoate-polyprenyltransferase Coq2 [Aureobasidium pullulans]